MADNNDKFHFHRIAYLSGAPSVSTRPEAAAVGPRSHITGFINAFKELGWEVIPFIVGDFVPKKWIELKTKEVSRKNTLARLSSDIIRIVMNFWFGKLAVKNIKNVDFVYERFGSFQNLGKNFQKRGIKWILETNGPFFVEAKQERKSLFLSRFARRKELQAYRDSDILVCISQPLKQMIVDELKIDPTKIIVLPNGVDTNFFSPDSVLPKRLFLSPVIGYVGAVIKRQGLELLLRVVADLLSRHIKLNLVIVGEGDDRKNLIELAEMLNISRNVNFIGQVPHEEIRSFIAGFDLGYSGQLVKGENLLSKMYHSPLKIYEYLSMGKPVIASAYDDANSLINDGENGYLFSPGDFNSLENAISMALEQKDQWPVMSNNARETIILQHSWEHRIETLISQLEFNSKKQIVGL